MTMTNEPVNVDAYSRKGKQVKKHIRRAGKRAQRTITGTRDLIEIDDLDDIGVLEVPSAVFEKLKAQVDTPINILKRSGLTPTHLKALVDANGVDSNGNVLVRNRRTGEGMRMKLFNFSPIPYTPSDLSKLSDEGVE